MMRARAASLRAALAVLASSACAGALAAPAAAPLASRPGPPALYGEDAPVRMAPVEARAIELALPRFGRGAARPRVSGALVEAARELARLAARGAPDPLARGPMRAALARGLSFDAAPVAVLVAAPPETAAETLARAAPRGPATHLGVGAAERDGIVHLVLLAADRRARLAPFPRDVAPGASAVLSGTLPAGAARPRVFVTLPSGAVREVDASGGRAFRARLEFPAQGRYVVEVIGEGEGGPEVAALLTVSAGAASLDPPAPVASGAKEPRDDASAEDAVLRALNDTRRRHGLPPLSADAGLTAVARRHSGAMAAAGRVAHVLPGSGDPGERLRRAAVPYRRAYENVARAGTALGAHEAVEESPAHLANVLRADATRVGVGIARARLPAGEPTVYLTEIIVQSPDDGASSRLTTDAQVREALWRERARLRLSPLTADAALDALARDAASAMRSRDDPQAPDLGDRALALRRGVAAVDLFVASAPGEATRSANLRDGRLRRVGVGVATGDSRRFGAGRLWIAVVYTD